VRDGGVEATFVPFDGAGFVDPGDIAKAIRPNTTLVVVTHGSNVTGTVQPLKEIGAVCREKGVTFLVDTAQTAGAIPIDMQEMNIDVLAFTGHKCLMGSMGIGGLSVRKHVEIRQLRGGGTGVRSTDPDHPEEYPWSLEYGTPNMAGVAALWAGQEWLDSRGMENIHAGEMKLAAKLADGLRSIPGVRLYCCQTMANHLPTIAMNLDGFAAADLGTMLDVDHHIATRPGLHCAPLAHGQRGTVEIHGAVRFSIGPFNTEEHIDAAIRGGGNRPWEGRPQTGSGGRLTWLGAAGAPRLLPIVRPRGSSHPQMPAHRALRRPEPVPASAGPSPTRDGPHLTGPPPSRPWIGAKIPAARPGHHHGGESTARLPHRRLDGS